MTATWLWMIENISQHLTSIAAILEISVGEMMSPKSTLKHLFGTGKDSHVSLKGEVLFKDIGLTGVGCRRNYRDVRISAADRFVNSMVRYGSRLSDSSNRS